MGLKIRMRSTTEGDISLIETWAQAIDSGQFMSRYLPDRARVVLWKIVIVDGVEIGTAWVERKVEQPNVVFLGILLSDPQLLGKRIGHTVICDLISAVRAIAGDVAIRLNVRGNNERAIACYKRCGFEQIAIGEITDGDGRVFPTLTMELASVPKESLNRPANDHFQ